MNWIELVAARICNTLRGVGMPESKARKVLDEELPEVIAATEAGRAFGADDSSEGNRKNEPCKPRSPEEIAAERKARELKYLARKWGGWEPWLG